MDYKKAIVFWSAVFVLVVLVLGSTILGKKRTVDYGGISVDEQAITSMLRDSTIMGTDNYTREENEARLQKATQCIKDRLLARLSHFDKAKANMDCDKKVPDIMMGVAEGLKDAGIITDDQLTSELDYIQSSQRSSLFPKLVPFNFCDLAK